MGGDGGVAGGVWYAGPVAGRDAGGALHGEGTSCVVPQLGGEDPSSRDGVWCGAGSGGSGAACDVGLAGGRAGVCAPAFG
jgi:hypothetical protein